MATELEVVIQGLRSHEGSVAASLYPEASAKSFPRDDKQAFGSKYVKIEGDEVRLRFSEVPEGTYAVSMMHDENGDGKMNMRLGIPLEGFGFSNDPTIYFGPPSFKKAQFKVEGETMTIHVRMKYLL